MIILNLIRVLILCQGSSPGRFFFPTDVMYFSRGLCREDRGKTKKLFTAVLALSWAFSVTAAERIVVAGGSLTELIYAMGAGERVVGVDETTSYPPETAKLPHIGYWKQLSSEGILSLRPDSVITWQDAGPQIVLDQLRAQKVNVVTLPRVPATLQQMYANIRQLAKTLQVPEQGEALVTQINQRLERVQQNVAAKKARLKPCLFSPQAEVRHRLPVKAASRTPFFRLPEQKTSQPTSSTKATVQNH